MEPGLEPGQQARFGTVQVHIGDTDLGESKLMRPGPQLPHDFGGICLVPLPHPTRLVTLTHPPILETRLQDWPDEAACQASARALAARAGITDASIELHGTLGAGKTTFVRHLLRSLGVTGRIKSPTYTVMEPYALPGGTTAAHFDFYRFTDPREWFDAGLRDVYAQPGLKLAEWPERAADLLPVPDLRIFIEPDDGDVRQVHWQACTARGQSLLP